LDTPNVVAPGQACVLYDGERVLAGSFIRAPGPSRRAAPGAQGVAQGVDSPEAAA
jgi:hypothetical protein